MATSTGRGGARHAISIIGLDAAELPYLRALVSLLRHPDASVGELARHALEYLSDNAAGRGIPGTEPLDHAG